VLDRRRGDASAAILAATSCSLRGSVSARRPACTWCTKSDTPCTEAGGGAQAFAEPYGRVGHTAWWWSFRGSVPCVVGWRSWCSCGATAVVAAVVVGACGMCGLLEGGCCLGEALTGNCLLGARMVFPQLLWAVTTAPGRTALGRIALGRTAPGRTVSETGGGGQVGCSSRGLLRWYAHWKRSAAWFSSEPGIGHRRKGLIVAWSLVRTHHSARTSASLRPPGFDDGQR